MLRPSFFARTPLACARELIGLDLVWGPCRGRIVETEAYLAIGDEASHTFSRKSTREFLERHAPGTAYVYLNYGMHWLFNVLVKGGGGDQDGFVLFRALEPTAGLLQMRRRRSNAVDRALCAGPGRLTQARGIGERVHGRDLCGSSPHGIVESKSPRPAVLADLRIGISRSADFPWRFLAADSPFVSVRATASAQKL